MSERLDDRDMRNLAIELAVKSFELGLSPGEVISRAQEIYDFMGGRREAPKPKMVA